MTAEEAHKKKLDLKEEISKHYKWAIENPTLLTVSALQDEWIRYVEDEILPKWEADLNRLKTDRMALAKRLKKFHADHQPESEQTWAECETELRAIINELESKSETAKRCTNCDGKGRWFGKKCPICGGSGLEPESSEKER